MPIFLVRNFGYNSIIFKDRFRYLETGRKFRSTGIKQVLRQILNRDLDGIYESLERQSRSRF